MKPIYDQAVRAEIRNRISRPNRESVGRDAFDSTLSSLVDHG